MNYLLLIAILLLPACSIGVIRHKAIGSAECYKRTDGYSCDVDMFRLIDVLTVIERCDKKATIVRLD